MGQIDLTFTESQVRDIAERAVRDAVSSRMNSSVSYGSGAIITKAVDTAIRDSEREIHTAVKIAIQNMVATPTFQNAIFQALTKELADKVIGGMGGVARKIGVELGADKELMGYLVTECRKRFVDNGKQP